MRKIVSSCLVFPYILPIISGILMILAFPPFELWYLGFIALVPFYLFLSKEKSFSRVFKGGVILEAIFSGYLLHMNFSSFSWLPATYLFTDIVRFLYIPITIIVSIFFGGMSVLYLVLKRKSCTPLERALLLGIIPMGGWIISALLLGLNYSSFAYVGVHLYLFRMAAYIGGMMLVAFLVVFTNAAIGELVILIQNKHHRWFPFILPSIVLLGMLLAVSFIYNDRTASSTISNQKILSIAIIQDQSRSKDKAFGKDINSAFYFDELKQLIYRASLLKPDVIVYPYSPWLGFISDKVDNSSFNKKVITLDFKSFGAWLKPQLSTKVTFIVWGNEIKNKKYINELEFWRGGNLIGTYPKKDPFPFMDYTPKWAQDIGIYSTPFDITAATSTISTQISGIQVGGLVCSEVNNPDIAREDAKGADILFALGSEAMFNNPIAGEFDIMSAQFRAVETGRPVIRGNRFGPSAIIDKNGTILKYARYGSSGVLFGKVTTTLGSKEKMYNPRINYIFLGIFIMYIIFLFLRKRQ